MKNRVAIRGNWQFAAVCQFFALYERLLGKGKYDPRRYPNFGAMELEHALLRPYTTDLLKELVAILVSENGMLDDRRYIGWHEGLIKKLEQNWAEVDPNERPHRLCEASRSRSGSAKEKTADEAKERAAVELFHFNDLTPADKLTVMYWLCVWMVNDNEAFLEKLRSGKVDPEEMRPQFLGKDGRGNLYYAFSNDFWIFRESKSAKKAAKGRSIIPDADDDDEDEEEEDGEEEEEDDEDKEWSVVCTTEEEFESWMAAMELEVKSTKNGRKRKGRRGRARKESTLSDKQRSDQVKLLKSIREDFIPTVKPVVQSRIRQRAIQAAPRKRSSRVAKMEARREELEAQKERERVVLEEKRRVEAARAEERRRERERIEQKEEEEEKARRQKEAEERAKIERMERARKRELAIQRKKEAAVKARQERLERAKARRQKSLEQRVQPSLSSLEQRVQASLSSLEQNVQASMLGLEEEKDSGEASTLAAATGGAPTSGREENKRKRKQLNYAAMHLGLEPQPKPKSMRPNSVQKGNNNGHQHSQRPAVSQMLSAAPPNAKSTPYPTVKTVVEAPRTTHLHNQDLRRGTEDGTPHSATGSTKMNEAMMEIEGAAKVGIEMADRQRKAQQNLSVQKQVSLHPATHVAQQQTAQQPTAQQKLVKQSVQQKYTDQGAQLAAKKHFPDQAFTQQHVLKQKEPLNLRAGVVQQPHHVEVQTKIRQE